MDEQASVHQTNSPRHNISSCDMEGHEDLFIELGSLLLELDEDSLQLKEVPPIGTTGIGDTENYSDLCSISKDILDDLAAGWPTPRSVAPSHSKRNATKLKKKRDRSRPAPEADFDAAIKAMRLGNLDSIQANFQLANSHPCYARSRSSALSLTDQRAAYHRDIVMQYNACFALSDTNRLALFIRDHCHEYVMYLSPHNYEPVIGKGDFMILMSLVIESYPDAVGTVTSFEQEENKIRYVVAFSGTKMYPYPIEVVFKQIREHLRGVMTTSHVVSDDAQVVNQELVRAITSKIQSSVAEKLRRRLEEENSSDVDSASVATDTDSSRIGSDSNGPGGVPTGSSQKSEELADDIMRDELVEFQWQTTFYFDQEDRIIQIISFEV